MKVLFVYSQDQIYSTQRPLEYVEYIQIGISYISALLKQHGHQTRLVVLDPHHLDRSKKILVGILGEFTPRLVCFSAVSTQYDFISALADLVRKQHRGVFQIIGGAHASLNPDEVIAGPFDAVCVGEGEFPILELVSRLESGEAPIGINNLWIKRHEGIDKTPPRPFLQDLDGLPFPDREIWSEWIVPWSRPHFSILLGRGCPFECTYCCNHAFKHLSTGQYVRFRSPGNILAEIEELVARQPTIEELFFEVETIGLHRSWVLELCEKIQAFNVSRARPISYGTNIRVTPNCQFDDLFTAMAKAGFRHINIGLESGSERVRREILHRNYSNEDVIRTVTAARAHGLRVRLFNLVGIPGETREDFDMTVQVNRACRPDWHYTSIFYPYPGTRLHALCRDQGLLDRGFRKNGVERCRAVLDLPGFPRREIERRHVWFDYSVYKGIQPLRRILLSVLRTKLRGYPRVMSAARRISRSLLGGRAGLVRGT